MPPISVPDFEFLLFEGFSNIALSCAMEPLRDAKLRAGRQRANWVVSTLDGKPVESSSALKVLPDRKFDPSHPARRVVLVAGYGVREISNPGLRTALRGMARNCEMIIALDTASWVLADAGLLDGQAATIHWQELEEFAETFPQVSVSNERFVKSGRFYSCGGASTVLDLMFEVLSTLFGPETAFQASNMFIYSRENTTPPAKEFPRLNAHGSKTLLLALDLISKSIDAPLTIPELANRIGISERTLHRLFLDELQTTPGKFITQYRLKQAKYLTQSTQLSLEQISLRCGYGSAASLCRSYKTTFGATLRGRA